MPAYAASGVGSGTHEKKLQPSLINLLAYAATSIIATKALLPSYLRRIAFFPTEVPVLVIVSFPALSGSGPIVFILL